MIVTHRWIYCNCYTVTETNPGSHMVFRSSWYHDDADRETPSILKEARDRGWIELDVKRDSENRVIEATFDTSPETVTVPVEYFREIITELRASERKFFQAIYTGCVFEDIADRLQEIVRRHAD